MPLDSPCTCLCGLLIHILFVRNIFIIFIDALVRSVDKPSLYVKRHSHLRAANLPFFIAALM
ncbi:MAG TPA: hypothetical protein VHN13_11520, partial [Candidatus Tectomicrobia bacterium]|nr:hypothetical protein [Candidatus Tectomicrobia bacterium]